MTFSASAAHELAEFQKGNSAWNTLFNRIKQEAELGRLILIFDEEKENVRFEEHRKIVKENLEKWGYRVSFRRVVDSDNWYGHTYHNEYTIQW